MAHLGIVFHIIHAVSSKIKSRNWPLTTHLYCSVHTFRSLQSSMNMLNFIVSTKTYIVSKPDVDLLLNVIQMAAIDLAFHICTFLPLPLKVALF